MNNFSSSVRILSSISDFILFYFIILYYTLFYFIIFYYILFYFILLYFICSILFYFTIFYFILLYFICSILFYFIIFYFFYFILFYFIFYFLALFEHNLIHCAFCADFKSYNIFFSSFIIELYKLSKIVPKVFWHVEKKIKRKISLVIGVIENWIVRVRKFLSFWPSKLHEIIRIRARFTCKQYN